MCFVPAVCGGGSTETSIRLLCPHQLKVLILWLIILNLLVEAQDMHTVCVRYSKCTPGSTSQRQRLQGGIIGYIPIYIFDYVCDLIIF